MSLDEAASTPAHGARGVGLVLAASLAFATSAPLSKLVAPMDPIFIAVVRVTVAATLLSLWDARGLLRAVRQLGRSAWLRLIAGGALLGAHFGLFQWGLSKTSLPAAVSLVALEPLSVVLAAWLLFRLRPSRLEGLGLGFATVGAITIGLQASGAGEHTLAGDGIVLAAVMLFGFYVCASRSLVNQLSAIHSAPLVYAVAAIVLALWLGVSPQFSAPSFASLSSNQLLGLLALALVPTVIGHTLVQLGARFLRPSMVALVCPGETLGSAALGALALSIVPTGTEALGGLIILAGAGVAISAQSK